MTQIGHIHTLPPLGIIVGRLGVRHTVDNQVFRAPHHHGDLAVAASPTHEESIRVGDEEQIDDRATRGVELRPSRRVSSPEEVAGDDGEGAPERLGHVLLGVAGVAGEEDDGAALAEVPRLHSIDDDAGEPLQLPERHHLRDLLRVRQTAAHSHLHGEDMLLGEVRRSELHDHALQIGRRIEEEAEEQAPEVVHVLVVLHHAEPPHQVDLRRPLQHRARHAAVGESDVAVAQHRQHVGLLRRGVEARGRRELLGVTASEVAVAEGLQDGDGAAPEGIGEEDCV